MKVSEIGLKKGEEKIAIFYTEDVFYIGIKGKGLFKVLEIEEVKPRTEGSKTIKVEKARDTKGRFVKCS